MGSDRARREECKSALREEANLCDSSSLKSSKGGKKRGVLALKETRTGTEGYKTLTRSAPFPTIIRANGTCLKQSDAESLRPEMLRLPQNTSLRNLRSCWGWNRRLNLDRIVSRQNVNTASRPIPVDQPEDRWTRVARFASLLFSPAEERYSDLHGPLLVAYYSVVLL